VSGAIRIALVVAVAIAATAAANFVLIGVATGQQDPVGRLVPQAGGGRPTQTRQQPAPSPAVHLKRENRERDD
jgi:hypothetical protein